MGGWVEGGEPLQNPTNHVVLPRKFAPSRDDPPVPPGATTEDMRQWLKDHQVLPKGAPVANTPTPLTFPLGS